MGRRNADFTIVYKSPTHDMAQDKGVGLFLAPLWSLLTTLKSWICENIVNWRGMGVATMGGEFNESERTLGCVDTQGILEFLTTGYRHYQAESADQEMLWRWVCHF